MSIKYLVKPWLIIWSMFISFLLNISAAKMPELLICDGFHDVNCECEQYALLLYANLINIIIG